VKLTSHQLEEMAGIEPANRAVDYEIILYWHTEILKCDWYVRPSVNLSFTIK
jgi:hypothetical protein